MLLLDRRRDIVRVGALAVEHWRPARSGYELAGSRSLSDRRLACLEQELRALVSGELRQGRRPHLIVESAWLPVMLLPLDGRLWSRKRLHALFQHRLRELYDDEPRQWIERLDYTACASQALAYALPVALRDVLLKARGTVSKPWATLEPSFARSRVARKAPRMAHWWICIEQDRALAAVVRGGKVHAFDPAMPWPPRLAWDAAIRAETLKLGAEDLSEIVVSGFERCIERLTSNASQHRLLEAAAVVRHASESGAAAQ